MIAGVLFDLDGTLLDSAPDLVGALNHLRRQEGLAEVEVADFRHVASRGAVGLIRAGLPPDNEGVLEARREAFLEYYAANSLRATQPFDGVRDLLEQLQLRAVPWGVVTNKFEYLTLPILAGLGLLASASCVICGDTLSQRKPHPAPVQLACELLGLPPERVIMVGDDLRDIEAGLAAGTETALAAYGYLDPLEDARGVSAGYVIQAPADLLGLPGAWNES